MIFGSADNIAALKDSLDETQGDEGVGPAGTRILETGQLQSSPNYDSDDFSSAASGSAANRISGAPPRSRSNTLDNAQASGVDAVLHEIQELKDNQGRLEDSFKTLKACYQQNYTMKMEAIELEQYRCGLLEEQLSDFTELHQNEIVILEEELAGMEGKIAHQSYERARDFQEALEACQTRISKMELQQQQVMQLEVLENATVRTLLVNLINVLPVVMAVLLVFVSTVANCVVPLMKTWCCTLSVLLLVILLFVVIFVLGRYWDATSEYLHFFFLHATS